MIVPCKYYIQFWFGNSAFAFGTGWVMGVFASFFIPFLSSLYFGIFAVLLWQVQVCRYFWGDHRGAFQHAHQEYLVRRSIRKMLAVNLGKMQAFTLSLGYMTRSGSDLKDTCKLLLRGAREKKDQIALNLLHLKLADLYLKEDFYESQVEHLKEAVAAMPSHYICLFRLGTALERQGDAMGSIEQYERASQVAHDNSPVLQAYVLLQVDRINKSGPKRKAKIAGLRYLPW
jgi:hypothetical protein